MSSPVKDKTAGFVAGAMFLFFAILFFGLRAYVLLLSKQPAAGTAAGFVEDAALAAVLALLVLITLRDGKRLYFAIIFPFEILVALIGYANLQYINFYGENIRLFDLEYVQNMGTTWKETLRDLWVRPFDLLFFIVPLAAIILGGVILRRTSLRSMPGRRRAAAVAACAVLAAAGFFGARALKRSAETSGYAGNNVWIGFIRDAPRIGEHFRMIRAIRAKKAVSGPGRTAAGSPDADWPPFPLAGDEIRYGREYPFIRIPERDAIRMGIADARTAPTGSDAGGKGRPKRNVVFIILESFRCREIGVFGDTRGLTPFFDSLAAKGTLFTDFYGHCDMTAGAEFTALNSFYDVFRGVTVMRKHNRIALFSLPEILRMHGYANLWINSWPAEFDNSRDYFRRHGNFTIIDKACFPPDAQESGWAYTDEEIMKMAVAAMDKAAKPFFGVVLTATNHMPYEVPAPKFELGLAPDVYGKYLNTFHYTDYALGRFFDMIRDRDYFKNTVFFIFADTGNNRTAGPKLPAFDRDENEFHIPLLIYDPADERGSVVGDIGGQVDLAPTVLDMLGIRVANAFVGRSLLRKRDDAFYLAYHGRNVPLVRYYDPERYGFFNSATGRLSVLGRKDGKPIEVAPAERRRIVSRIRMTLDLGDWAIYNDRIWDRKLEGFYWTILGR